MAKGKKTPIEDVYKVMVGYASNKNIKDLASTLNMPWSTVKKIVDTNKDKPEFAKLCEEKAEEFADKATRIIDKATTLLEKRLTTALERQQELDETLDLIMYADKEDIDYKEKLAMAKRIGKIQLNALNEITTAIGTMYDKRALAKGENTSNQSLTIRMSEEVKELSK